MRKSILGAVLVLAVSTAHADDKKKARALYDVGLKHYNVAEYPEAIKAWKEAYLLSKRPLLLFNIGQAFRLSGDCKQAMVFYDSYQREEPSPKNQDELDQALALCKEQKAAVEPKPIEQPVTPPVQDKPPVTTPPTPPTVAQPEPTPEPPEDEIDEPEETTTGGGLRKIGLGVGLAGIALSGAGVYFMLDASSTSKELDGFAGEWGQEQIDLEAQGQRSSTLGLALGIGGAAAVIAGGVMFAVGGPKAIETTSMSVVPTKGGAQVGWAFRF
jgi:tetratricopeptide (TPR) repeat protein